MDDTIITNIFYIGIVVLILTGILLFLHIFHFNLNEHVNKKLLQVVTIESLKNINEVGQNEVGQNEVGQEEPLLLEPKDFINTDLEKDFCSGFKGSGSTQKLNESCGQLTNSNCSTTSCCILANGNRCLAGSASGPTFLTNTDGSNINVDYYYYQGKCYGSKCPTLSGESKV